MKPIDFQLKAALISCIMLFAVSCVPDSNPNLSVEPMTSTVAAATMPIIPTRTMSSTITYFTPSPAPTLVAEDANALMGDFLTNSSDCNLPCWLGITPGISTLAEVQARLESFDSIAEKIYIGEAGDLWNLGSLDLQLPKENIVVEIYSTFLISSNEDKVAIIGVDTQALSQNLAGQVYGDQNYVEALSAYTLSQILSKYGSPMEIWVTAEIYEFEQNAPDYFEIRLLYPDKGIFVRYKTPIDSFEENYRVCPSKSSVDLWLLAPDIGNSYQEKLLSLGDEWTGFFPPSNFNKPTIEAFGKSEEEFVHSIISSPTYCYESPKSIWPER